MTLPQSIIDAIDHFGDRCAEGLQTGVLLVERRRLLDAIERHVAPGQGPEDPMDWPLPCDITVGHSTIRKGVRLRALVLRMKVLHRMAKTKRGGDG